MYHKADASNSGRADSAVALVATGSYLPEKILTNADLAKMVDTSDEWITTRTGIHERHIAAAGQATSDMAAQAALRALQQAGLTAQALDLIIVATITPDMFFPSTACYVQKAIGAERAVCFDLVAACSGFIFAMETARRFILAGGYRNVMVIGAEKLSAITDWQDRSTCVLFGDGAGAAILQARPGARGIMATVMATDGNLSELLNIPGGGSRHPASEQTVRDRLHYIKMTGREVFKHAVSSMLNAAQEALRRSGVRIEEIACIIPHQANLRIIQAIGQRLGAPVEKYYVNLDHCGNMSAASVPVALDEAVRAGRIRRGDLVLLVAFGGGFTWAASVLEW